MTAWTDILLSKIRVLLGEVSSDGMQAVRQRDLVDVAITNKRQIGKGVITTTAIAPRSIVDDLIADAQLTARVFEEGIKPIELVDVLPSLGNVQGRMVFLRSENALYRHTGSPIGAAGFTRQIDGTYIDDDSISTPKLQADSVTTGKLAAGAVVSEKVAAGAILTQHLLVSGGNLISNPSFGTGDFADWRPFTLPLQQSVVARATAGVPANAPSAFVARYQFLTSGTLLQTFNGQNAFSGPGRAESAVRVISGEEYLMTVDAVKSAGVGVVNVFLRAIFLMADGTTLALAPSLNQPLTTTWATYSGTFVAPAGAVAVWPNIYAQHFSGAIGSVYWTNMSLRQKAAGNLLVDGVLAVQGMAAFGGTLQSGNFVPGSTGWQITQAGNAEFNSLVVRQDMIQSGAVSRQRVFSQNLPPSTSGTSALVVLATKTWSLANFSFAPFVTGIGETLNPIRIDYNIKVNFVNGGVFARLRVTPQYTIDGTNWVSLNGFYVTKEMDLRAGISFSDHTAFDIYDVTSQNVSQWIGLRVVASAVDGGGGFPVVNVSSAQFIFQQISR